MSTVKKQPSLIAREVMSYAQDAVGDMANDMLSHGSGFLDKPWKDRIQHAKKKGVRDVSGWLADCLYSDADTLSDLLGDRIHDEVGGDRAKYEEVLKELEKNAHAGLKKAVNNLRKFNN